MNIRKFPEMKLPASSLLAWSLVRGVGTTVRLRVDNLEPVVGRTRAAEGQILVTWHGRLLVPLFAFRGLGWNVMVSTSRDGEILSRVFQRFGWHTIRGSSRAGAARATLAAAKVLREGGTLTLSPDGPRGPARVVQPGTLYLARKTGSPVVPVGVSAHAAWRARSWDEFMVPKPFGRAAVLFGEPMWVPPDATSGDMSDIGCELARSIDAMESAADRLVRP